MSALLAIAAPHRIKTAHRRRRRCTVGQSVFRDYDPATGRYVQSDPIGLGGGVSSYEYVGSDPLSHIDHNGLVRWKGTIAYGSIPFGKKIKSLKITAGDVNKVTLDLESDCVNGKKYKASVLVTEWSFGLGAGRGRAESFIGSVEMEDGATNPSPQSLTGPFSLRTSGGLGSIHGSVRAGSASGTFSAKGASREVNLISQGKLGPFSMMPENCGCEY